jgi:hypothetical protein
VWAPDVYLLPRRVSGWRHGLPKEHEPRIIHDESLRGRYQGWLVSVGLLVRNPDGFRISSRPRPELDPLQLPDPPVGFHTRFPTTQILNA